jgi:hypothetical protein
MEAGIPPSSFGLLPTATLDVPGALFGAGSTYRDPGARGIFGIGSALIRWNAALVLWLRLSGDFMLALSLLSDVEIPNVHGAGASCPGTALLTLIVSRSR